MTDLLLKDLIAKMSKFEDLKKRFDEGEDPVDKVYLALIEQQKNG